MQGTPQTMQDNPQYDNVVDEIAGYLGCRLEQLLAAGVEKDRICLDPGIGFGKTHEHNLALLKSAAVFHQLGCPLLVGHSRKGFIAKVLNDKSADRTFATLGVSLALAQRGIQILRVHDVRATHQALLLFEAAGGFEPSVQTN
jgi:dihydropteroate synthase